MKNIITLILLLFFSNVNACLNGETKILKNGYYLYEDYEGIVPIGHDFNIYKSNKLLYELDQLYNKTKDLDYLSDKGYVLIILKRYDEALEIYKYIENKSPNRYSTASNIGTLYELIGNNEKALEWIKKSIQINIKSHQGSEWLHVNILEAKIKGEKFYTPEFLLKTSFGIEIQPKTKISIEKQDQLIASIYYQLNERISFIKSEDKIIAILLDNLACLAWLRKDYDSAVKIYKLSKKYGLNPMLADEKIEMANNSIQDSLNERYYEIEHLNDYHKNVILVLSVLLFISIFILIFYRKK